MDLILIADEPSRGVRHLADQLRRHNFDAALLLHPTPRLALACRLAGIPVRIGTGYRAYSLLFNRRVYQHRKNSDRHELDLNLQLAQAIGAQLQPVEFHLAVPEQAVQRVHELLAELGVTARQPYVVLHPGSGGSALDWPSQYFAKLAIQIKRQLKCAVIVTGSTEERALIDKIASNADHSIFRLDGRLNLKELAALLMRSRLTIANSTGPLHLAVAVGAPVIGIYCPIEACSPTRWGPYGREESVIMPQVPRCERCANEGCRYLNCMEMVSVQQVFALAAKKLSPGPKTKKGNSVS